MYEKFTPEFFEHPTLFAFYNWYLDLTCGISCLLYCLIIYIVRTRSTKDIHTYSLYLCVQFTWSVIFDILLTSLKPAMLYPFMLYYSRGPFAPFGYTISLIQFSLLLCTCVGFGITILHSALYRISKVNNNLRATRHLGGKNTDDFRYRETSGYKFAAKTNFDVAGYVTALGRDILGRDEPKTKCIFGSNWKPDFSRCRKSHVPLSGLISTLTMVHSILKIFDRPALSLGLSNLVVACGCVCVLTPLVPASRSQEELKAATLSKSPAMSALFAVERSIVGFETPSGNGNWWFDFASTGLVIVLVFGVVLLIGLNIGCFVLIRKRREMMSRKTYQMNITLYKVLTLQMVMISC
ncbi:serpentine type 7TM GPCR chemoreceptor srh domain-containing protein [Ditylenchus destructor]|uniref:Serpentine type 7TM GPCR chemoreceptor srh domain-containing protein n=1 Tax=Ditylenchus destructor TaxID=166010 RepID=A0AAD4MHM6_9BILA|nr:serpentine type 7TM GPCR chemoreceptor srh domain-containing protein [Ditylenchus destructor]